MKKKKKKCEVTIGNPTEEAKRERYEDLKNVDKIDQRRENEERGKFNQD